MKKIIYFPSFSTGTLGNSLLQNHTFKDGTSYRFWSEGYPEKYRHPYFLITAGHDFKRKEFSKKFDFTDDTLVFGDSGGYQIATGYIDWNLDIRKQIFDWLEDNAHISMNIDIPTRGKYAGKFAECLEISNDNFKYFADHQSGKTDFLNVIQGTDIIEYQKWYNVVNQYEFSGWALGGARTIYRMLAALCVLLDAGELHKKNNKWLHFLGISKVTDAIVLTEIQKCLEDIGSEITVTFDSSSPSRSTMYGLFYTGYNTRSGNFEYIRIPRTQDINRQLSYNPLPNYTDFDEFLWSNYTMEEFCQFSSKSYSALGLHNFAIFKDCFDYVVPMSTVDIYLKSQIYSKNIIEILECIDSIFDAHKAGNSAVHTFNRLLPKINKLSNILYPVAGESSHNFF